MCDVDRWRAYIECSFDVCSCLLRTAGGGSTLTRLSMTGEDTPTTATAVLLCILGALQR